MKKLFFIFLVVPFFFACEKDDETINVTVQDPSGGAVQEEYRIDLVEVTAAGSTWKNDTYLYLRIVDETNELNLFELVRIDGALPVSFREFQPSSRSEWRIFAYQGNDSEIDKAPAFSRTIKPEDYKNSNGTFSIPIENGVGFTELKFTVSGTVINVPVD